MLSILYLLATLVASVTGQTSHYRNDTIVVENVAQWDTRNYQTTNVHMALPMLATITALENKLHHNRCATMVHVRFEDASEVYVVEDTCEQIAIIGIVYDPDSDQWVTQLSPIYR